MLGLGLGLELGLGLGLGLQLEVYSKVIPFFLQIFLNICGKKYNKFEVLSRKKL